MPTDSDLKTAGVKQLAELVLAKLPAPLTEDVIEDVFCAIERHPGWLIEYDGLCTELTKTVVNNWIGVWVTRYLGLVGVRDVATTRTKLARSYSKLSLPAVIPGAKRKEQEAKEVMSDYYRTNRARLPANIADYRTELVKLLMDGKSAEDAFAIALGREPSG